MRETRANSRRNAIGLFSLFVAAALAVMLECSQSAWLGATYAQTIPPRITVGPPLPPPETPTPRPEPTLEPELTPVVCSAKKSSPGYDICLPPRKVNPRLWLPDIRAEAETGAPISLQYYRTRRPLVRYTIGHGVQQHARSLFFL